MMKKKNWGKALTLCILLSSPWTVAEAEPLFGNGTYSISGGKYVYNGRVMIISSLANITGEGDIVLDRNSSSGGGPETAKTLNGATLNWDMQGHNLSLLNHKGDVALQNATSGNGAPSYINLTNVGALVLSSQSNALLDWEGDVNIQAKSVDITSGYPCGTYRADSSITINAEQDINLTSTGNGWLEWNSNNQNIKLNSAKGNITVDAQGGRAAYIRDKASFHAGKDIDMKASQVVIYHKTADADDAIEVTSDTGTIKLTTTGAYYAVFEESGKINFHGNTEINAPVGAGVYAQKGAVTFDKGLVIKTDGAAAVKTETTGVVTALDKTVAKQIAGNLVMTDDATGAIQINLGTADSYLTGYAKQENTGLIDLEFANGATWNLTGDSIVNNLGWNGSTFLNMNYTGDGNYETLRAQNFTGTNGHIMLTTDLQSSHDTMNVQAKSDRIKIIDGSSGTYTVDIADASALTGTAAEGYLLIVEDAYWKDKDYNNMATFVGGNLRKGGIFKYKPILTNIDPDATSGYSGVTTDQRPDGCGGAGLGHNPPCDNPKHVWTKQSWYLTASEKTDEMLDSAKPLLGAAGARYLSYRQEMDTLLQRLGELRNDEQAAGLWLRYKRGSAEIANIGVKSSQYNMAQMGYDHQTSKDKQGNRNLVGFAFNHSWGKQKYVQNATGDSGANVFSFYDTWLGNKGHYWDLVGKVGRLYKDYDYTGDNVTTLDDSGSDGSLFYSLSAEYGRKAFLGSSGWYVEPQTQLTYGRINSSDFTTDKLITVHNGAVNSLVGRIGLTLGKEINTGKTDKTNIYGKVFWNREFRGALTTHMQDSYGDSYDSTDDYTGNWGTVGLGITSKVSKKNDLYLDVEKTFGGSITTKWQVNAGARWNF